MGDHINPKDEADLRVTIRSPADEAVDEWDDEFVESAATTIDPAALTKLRLQESATAAPTRPKSSNAAPAKRGTSSFEKMPEVVDEFDDHDMTVMDPRSLAARDPSTESHAPAHEPCPKCGVMVAPGYPKCPRCKAVLIKGSAPREQAKGGTSVIGRTIPWTIVVMAAIVTAVIYYLAERDLKTSTNDSANDAEAPLQHAAPADGQEDDQEIVSPNLDNITGEADEGANK